MTWQVMSSRLAWNEGETVTVADLAGCNIGALVESGHLVPVPTKPKSKRMPVEPVPTDTADEPEEQE
jgi:hypothetical protein